MKKHEYSLQGASITKLYGNAAVLRDISLSMSSPSSLAITGPNGSGKTTLLEIIAGIQRPTKGTVQLFRGDTGLRRPWFQETGYVSPRLRLYDELTAEELIEFTCASRSTSRDRADEFLSMFNLLAHKRKMLSQYSSGMAQRLKCILAFINEPPLLLLDEPGSNLDREGKDALFRYLESIRSERILIIATNEKEEADFCRERISLG
ncbi:MAG TPA: ATP-binding cassette domain-containing protein [Spirochaetota bacterium]|nr:ATP-binding cassette domain-containing protein [Spirochaetota bacterium]